MRLSKTLRLPSAVLIKDPNTRRAFEELVKSLTTEHRDVYDSLADSGKLPNNALKDAYDANQDAGERSGFPDTIFSEATMDFDDATRTFFIKPIGDRFHYYVSSRKYIVKDKHKCQITDTEGIWYFYFTGDTLAATQTKPTANPEWYKSTPPVAIVRWDATDKAHRWLQEERHGIQQSGADHKEWHEHIGATWHGGLDVSGYTLDDDSDVSVQVGLSNGEIHDEDIEIAIIHSATPSARFEQKIQHPGEFPVMYYDGATPRVIKDAATSFPFKNDPAPSRVVFNFFTGGVWYQPEVDDNYYVAYYMVSFGAQSEPVRMLMGQRQDQFLDDAKENNILSNLNLAGYEFDEIKPLYRFIYRSKTSFGGTRHTKLVHIEDLRAVTVAGGSTVIPTQHNILLGRDVDNCHPLSAITGAEAHGMGHITIESWAHSAIIQGAWGASLTANIMYNYYYWNSSQANQDELNFSVDLAKGTYTILMLAPRAPDQGVVDIYIDSTEVASFDKYGSLSWNLLWDEPGIIVSTAGRKTIKLIVDGKHPSSSNYRLAFVSLVFFKTD